jgi:ABC-2 type transport system ATP-binding protein
VRRWAAALAEVVRALDAEGITAQDIALRRPTLDEVFLHLTGHRAHPAAVQPTEQEAMA